MVSAEPLPPAARREIADVLSERELALFQRYSLEDQWHSYCVLCTLKAAGYTHPDLLAAALLHDVGKMRLPLSIWERSLIVLAQFLLPRKTSAWGQGQARGWRRPFVVKASHPAWGADMARAAGSRPLTIALICHHQDNLADTGVVEMSAAEVQLLRHLQWADDQN